MEYEHHKWRHKGGSIITSVVQLPRVSTFLKYISFIVYFERYQNCSANIENKFQNISMDIQQDIKY